MRKVLFATVTLTLAVLAGSSRAQEFITWNPNEVSFLEDPFSGPVYTERDVRFDPRPPIDLEERSLSFEMGGQLIEYETYSALPHEALSEDYDGVYADFLIDDRSAFRASLGHTETSFELLEGTSVVTGRIRYIRRF